MRTQIIIGIGVWGRILVVVGTMFPRAKTWEVSETCSRQDREGTAQESSMTEKPVAIAALDSR